MTQTDGGTGPGAHDRVPACTYAPLAVARSNRGDRGGRSPARRDRGGRGGGVDAVHPPRRRPTDPVHAVGPLHLVLRTRLHAVRREEGGAHGPRGQIVGDTAPPRTRHPGARPIVVHLLLRHPRHPQVRASTGSPRRTSSGSNYSFDDLVRWRWQLDYWSTPRGDQEAIDAVWNRVNAANARGPLQGLQTLSAVAWPALSWTPQMIVCPTHGSTLAQALRKVIAPNAVVQDRPYFGNLTPTPGWTPSDGPGAGRVPLGRIYPSGSIPARPAPQAVVISTMWSSRPTARLTCSPASAGHR